MELGVHDRLLLLGLLPEKGDFTTLKIVMELRAALSFSEDEHKEFKLQEVPAADGNGNMVQWEKEAEKVKNVAIGLVAHELIVKALKDLDAKRNLTMGHLELYERFVVNPTSHNGVEKALPVPAAK